MLRTFSLLFLLFPAIAAAQNPRQHWLRYKTPEQAGWSSEKLTRICRNSNANSVLLVHNGKIAFAYGEYARRMKCHSMRKSFLSALYGIFVERGAIDTSATLRQLGVTNDRPLTDDEKEARILDLLTARSGVYLPSGQETDQMASSRPARGSHVPGVYWYYNNWDFNALGTIFRKTTGRDIFEAFATEIANPLRMEDFSVLDGVYDYEPPDTSHPGYMFLMSARDAARFGQLYLQRGRWDSTQVVPESWINESTAAHSYTYNPFTSYGYLWWVIEDFEGTRMYYAAGHGGQRICVLPSLNTVCVINADSYSDNSVLDVDYVIPDLVFKARTGDAAPDAEFVPLEEPSGTEPFSMSDEQLRKFAGTHTPGDTSVIIFSTNEGLLLEGYHYSYRFRLTPVAPDRLYAHDINLLLCFTVDSPGTPRELEIHKSEATYDLYRLILDRGLETAEEQFASFRPRFRKKEELEFLCDQLTPRGVATLPLRELNAACFPYSYKAQLDLKDELLKTGTLQSARDVFAGLLASPGGLQGTKTEWFANILEAFTARRTVTPEEAMTLAGGYGYRTITADEGELFYSSGGRMLPLYRMSGLKFAIEDTYHMYLEFGKDISGVANRLIGRYYRDSSDETFR